VSCSPTGGLNGRPSNTLELIGTNVCRVDEFGARSEEMDMRWNVAYRKSSQVDALVPRCEERPAHKLLAIARPWVGNLYGREVVSIARLHPAKKMEAKRRLVVVRIEPSK
jgi:hypothetical protein